MTSNNITPEELDEWEKWTKPFPQQYASVIVLRLIARVRELEKQRLFSIESTPLPKDVLFEPLSRASRTFTYGPPVIKTLLDEFAMAALSVILIRNPNRSIEEMCPEIAGLAYNLAEAMMAEKLKWEGKE